MVGKTGEPSCILPTLARNVRARFTCTPKPASRPPYSRNGTFFVPIANAGAGMVSVRTPDPRFSSRLL